MDIFIKIDKGPGMWSSCLESPKINPSTHRQGCTRREQETGGLGLQGHLFVTTRWVLGHMNPYLKKTKQQKTYFIMWTYTFNLASGKCLQTSKFALTNINYKRSQCASSKYSSNVLPIGLCLCSLLDLNHGSCSGLCPFSSPTSCPMHGRPAKCLLNILTLSLQFRVLAPPT